MIQKPHHPGHVLVEKFLKPYGITQMYFAFHLGWPYARLNEIINARRGVTADSALALSEAIPQTSPEYWLSLQNNWDLWQAKQVHIPVKPLRDFKE
jgi:addiction module HigA family antidote